MTTTPVRALGYAAAAWCIGFTGVTAWQLAAGLAIMGVLAGVLKLAGAALALAAVLVWPGRPRQLLGVGLWGPLGCLACTRRGTTWSGFTTSTPTPMVATSCRSSSCPVSRSGPRSTSG
jgi:hypothetical protein